MSEDQIKSWSLRTDLPIEEARRLAEKSNFIPHQEPHCNTECGREDPHRHGLPCYAACNDCRGLCHPECPAYDKEKYGDRGQTYS